MTVSDRTSNINSLKADVRNFIAARDWDQFHSPKDLAIGLITEAGELLEHFRFRDEAEVAGLLNTPEFRELVQHELADCLYFVLAISNKLNMDLTQALAAKMEISEKRYPVEKSRGRNDKYTAWQT